MKKKLLLSIIIVTKDRQNFLKKTLIYLKKNSFFFNEVIIVDSSKNKLNEQSELLKKFKKMNIKIYHSKPSTSHQRNLGIVHSNKKNKYIMFLDDDIKFYKNAFLNMQSYLLNINSNIVGIGFNPIVKNKKNFFESIKKSFLFKCLGIYDSRPGAVVHSGWHTKIINVKKNIKVDWLSTQACIYLRQKIMNHKFDNNLGEYAYLEDLIFSYKISKKNTLMINSNAKFYSYNPINRKSFFFGLQEIKNRIIFIKKNNFKIYRFLIGYFFFILKNLVEAVFNLRQFPKFIGNVFGIFYILKNNQ